MTGSRVVIGFDGSPSAWRALDWATQRVDRRGGTLDVVAGLDTRLGAAVFGPRAEVTTGLEFELRQAQAHVRDRAPAVSADFRWVDGPPAGALLRAAEGASLLVVGTDRRTDGSGARIGSLPLRVAAKAECPVAVIPDMPDVERNVVVVGVDESPFGRSALALAVTEASWLRADIEAVHAWDVPEIFHRALDEGTDVDPAYLARQNAVVPDAIADVPTAHEAPITPVVLRQNPASALIERARGAALLVVGTRGRGRFTAAVVGSVSHDVLLNLPCPVLVTPKEYTFVTPDVAAEV
ncbi:universal stress protein [Leifsonia xyli]|uniref:universal stress protein n=1 Tax=Leifsonia xyli TaxID=1575 RepID=UPI003D67436C